VTAPKLTFDPAAPDDAGLTGPPDGQVAAAYELCIPATAAHEVEVRALDPTAAVQRGAPGRVGCGPGQWLVVGSTHQPGWQPRWRAWRPCRTRPASTAPTSSGRRPPLAPTIRAPRRVGGRHVRPIAATLRP
jgi:hypothetical protein